MLDPEQKRRIIGHTFIDVFDARQRRIGGANFLGQGTLYPDVIESVSFKGPSAVDQKSITMSADCPSGCAWN